MELLWLGLFALPVIALMMWFVAVIVYLVEDEEE